MKSWNRMRVGLLGGLVLLCGLGWKTSRTLRQEQLNRQLIAAIKHNTMEHETSEEVRAYLKRGADPNTRDDPAQAIWTWNRLLVLIGLRKALVASRQPALLLALEGDLHEANEKFYLSAWWTGDPKIVKALVEYGADIEVKDRYGRTPLVTAFDPVPRAKRFPSSFYWPHVECEQLLIEAGADVEARDEEGLTALMGLANEAVVKALLRRRADVKACAKDGSTALMYHAGEGDETGCRLLLEHGAEINAFAKDGSTALIRAAWSGNSHLIDLLLQHGADVNANVGHGDTALIAATAGSYDAPGAAAERYKIVRTLLQQGAVVDARGEGRRMAFIEAARAGDVRLVNLLLQYGAKVNADVGSDQTALMAASEGHSAVVWILLQHGARVSPRDGNGWTALTHAAYCNSIASVRLLLEHGAAIPGKDKNGDSLAALVKNGEGADKAPIMKLLKAHGMEAEP